MNNVILKTPCPLGLHDNIESLLCPQPWADSRAARLLYAKENGLVVFVRLLREHDLAVSQKYRVVVSIHATFVCKIPLLMNVRSSFSLLVHVWSSRHVDVIDVPAERVSVYMVY